MRIIECLKKKIKIFFQRIADYRNFFPTMVVGSPVCLMMYLALRSKTRCCSKFLLLWLRSTQFWNFAGVRRFERFWSAQFRTNLSFYKSIERYLSNYPLDWHFPCMLTSVYIALTTPKNEKNAIFEFDRFFPVAVGSNINKKKKP